jgi:hypothetical protein
MLQLTTRNILILLAGVAFYLWLVDEMRKPGFHSNLSGTFNKAFKNR